MSWQGVFLLAGCLLALATPAARGATFVVNNRFDTGTGGCTASECTLREAITAANATAAADTINFAFSTSLGPEILIQPTSRLPAITQPLTLNGYSVAGAAVNTHPFRSDAVIRIRLDGSSIPVGSMGVGVCANNTSIRGLSVTGFAFGGIAIGQDTAAGPCGPVTGGLVAGNFLGLTTDGSTAAGNFGPAVVMAGSVAVVGGSAPADRNVIGSNEANGVQIQGQGGAGSRIEGNLIGTDRNGRQARSNAGAGVHVSGSASGITIGSDAAPNRIAFNRTGIQVQGSASAIQFRSNDFVLNSELAVDLRGTVGVTSNDNADADAGPNGLQNYLDAAFATRVSGGLRIRGSLRRPGTVVTSYTIAAYVTSRCDISGHGEGEYVGALSTATSGSVASIDVTIPTSTPPAAGSFVSTTVTAADGSTSEFSACTALDPAPLVVTSTADTDGTTCGAVCTLRQAINAANTNPGPKVISFDIPGNGERLIQPTSALPMITAPVTIDGYSQPGTSVNTLDSGSSAVLLVRLDGDLAGNSTGLKTCASDTVVQGLAITGFSQHGIEFIRSTLSPNCAAAPRGGKLLGNHIGVATDGVTAAGNQFVGAFAIGHQVEVGSDAVADRNLISANGEGIAFINVGAERSRVVNNLIGTDRSGTLDRGNSGAGVTLAQGSSGSVVGTEAGPNVIRFNGTGVIGRNETITPTLLDANHYADNDGLAIDLQSAAGANVGPTPNDAGDPDQGANGLQNFPELQLAEVSDSGLRLRGRVELPVGTANVNYRITAYASTGCDASGFGEGEGLLGSGLLSLSSVTDGNFDFLLATTPAVQPGTQITATATGPEGTSEFSTCLSATAPPPGIVVNAAADPGTGGCTQSECTLREAIELANARAGADLIRFQLVGNGPFRTTPLTSLPVITEALTIDGYTQIGASPNAAEIGTDATVMIELRGQGGTSGGLAVCASDVILRGLSITGFSTFGIRTDGAAGACSAARSNVRVEGSFLGIAPDGSAVGNQLGIDVSNTQAVIGGPEPADRNLIGGNNTGVKFGGAAASGGLVINTLFGTDPSSLAMRPNTAAAVDIAGASNVTVGERGKRRNLVAFNRVGVVVRGDAQGNRLLNNEFVANDNLAIDLSASLSGDGPDLNDVNDVDTGPNGRQNSPVLSSGSVSASSLTVTGLLDVPEGLGTPTAYTLAFYESAACDANGLGQGELFIDAQTVEFRSTAETFSVTLPITPSTGRVISATATDPAGNTSEFSNCFVTPAPPQLPAIFANSFE